MLEQRDHSTDFFPADIRDRLDDPGQAYRDQQKQHSAREGSGKSALTVCREIRDHSDIEVHKPCKYDTERDLKHGVSEIGTPELRNRNDRRYSKSCFRI